MPAAPAVAPSALAAESFRVVFRRDARWLAAAHGRVNLIGEHTDYNEGFVLPMAIDPETVIAAAPNGSDTIVLCSVAKEERIVVDLSKALSPDAKGSWVNYCKGVVAGFQALGVRVPGFDAVIETSVPLGAGLSSSAALEVATATLLEGMLHIALAPEQKALLCQQAEHRFAGMPCGIMDQFISVCGRADHALLLDCRSNTPDWVPLDDPGVVVLIIDSRVKHANTSNDYAVRRRSCEVAAEALGVRALRDASLELLAGHGGRLDDASVACARHVITENARTLRAADCMRRRDWVSLGQLLYQSHVSMRDDFKASCPELDTLVDIARAIGLDGGVYGCRMTGGGFGGSAVALIASDARDAIMSEIHASYRRRTGREAHLSTSRAAAGASLIEL